MQNTLTPEQWRKHGLTLRGTIAWKRQAEERLKKLFAAGDLMTAEWYVWRGAEQFRENLTFNFMYNIEYKHFGDAEYISILERVRDWESGWMKRIRQRITELEVAKGFRA